MKSGHGEFDTLYIHIQVANFISIQNNQCNKVTTMIGICVYNYMMYI